MSDEHVIDAAEKDEFSAAAPPDPEAPGTGETSFADAEAPAAAGERREAEAAEDEVAKWKDVAHRKAAEFDNFRKRMARENASAAERGAAKLVKELLPALDNLERALAAAESQPDGTEHHLSEGIRLVQAELVAAMARVGVEGYSPKGERFDPNVHEAMAQQPVDGAESGTIVEVFQSGYRIGGDVIRPARVVVAA